MGVWHTKPLPDVDLLPPRFERRSPPVDRVAVTPLEYLFARERLDQLFSNHFAAPRRLHVRGALRPDYEQRSLVAFQADLGADALSSV
jgi:hypothetical protein